MITVLFWQCNVIFDAAAKRSVKGMNEAENKITFGDIVYDDAKSNEIVDFVDVLIVFCEFFVKGIDGFGAAGDFEFDFFFV